MAVAVIDNDKPAARPAAESCRVMQQRSLGDFFETSSKQIEEKPPMSPLVGRHQFQQLLRVTES